MLACAHRLHSRLSRRVRRARRARRRPRPRSGRGATALRVARDARRSGATTDGRRSDGARMRRSPPSPATCHAFTCTSTSMYTNRPKRRRTSTQPPVACLRAQYAISLGSSPSVSTSPRWHSRRTTRPTTREDRMLGGGLGAHWRDRRDGICGQRPTALGLRKEEEDSWSLVARAGRWRRADRRLVAPARSSRPLRAAVSESLAARSPRIPVPSSQSRFPRCSPSFAPIPVSPSEMELCLRRRSSRVLSR